MTPPVPSCTKELPPPPEILYAAECERLLELASPDSRDYLVVLLLLESGIKKQELMNIRLADIDLSNPYRPTLWIRHERNRNKETKLRLPTEFSRVLEGYVEKYKPRERLLECTGRHVNNILHNLAERAGIGKSISPQMLRDTCAVRELQKREGIDTALRKLGLAPTSINQEAREKYLKLAGRARHYKSMAQICIA